MAKYTFELREVVDTFGRDEVKGWFSQYELSDFLTPEQIQVIEEAGVWSKDRLCERILDHFWTREIGTDAIGQFMLFVKDKMNETMESYASVIYSVSLKFNPLGTADYTETFAGTTSGDTSSASTGKSSGLDIASDTPQGQISKSEILSGKYASSTAGSESESESSGSSKSAGTQDYTKKIQGNTGKDNSELLINYRKTIRAINTEIIYELEPLFMGIY